VLRSQVSLGASTSRLRLMPCWSRLRRAAGSPPGACKSRAKWVRVWGHAAGSGQRKVQTQEHNASQGHSKRMLRAQWACAGGTAYTGVTVYISQGRW